MFSGTAVDTYFCIGIDRNGAGAWMEFPQLVVPVVVVAEFQRASIHLDNVTMPLAGHGSVHALRWLSYK